VKRALAFGLAALFGFGFAARDARGAGLSRPNIVGARAVGMGGAFTGIADDPTAVWHNPAGTALYGDNVGYVGLEIVAPQRTYTPDASSTLGQAGLTKPILENSAPNTIPVIGFSTRFGFGKSAPTRFAFSLLAYDPYGGSISFKPSDISSTTMIDPNTGKPKILGLQSTQILDFELTPTLAYQVSDVFSVGAGLRIGINSFSVNDTEAALAATLNGSGVGLGGILGVMLRPHRLVQIGAVYRTPMSVSISGSGPVTIGTGANATKNQTFGLDITWPQSAGLGVTVYPHRRLTVSVQADWTAWSSIQTLTVNVAGIPQVKEMRYLDTYAVHAGLQGVITRWLVLRGGAALDSNAIPDRTLRRENQDNLKATVAAGFGLHFWRIFIDGAFELLVPGPARVVSQPLPSMTSPENEPGAYSAVVYTAELSAQIRF
jgi:long-chain fatty acid transport protein